MKPKKQASNIADQKRSLLNAFTSAYMYRNRIQKQNARIRALIQELREAGVGDDELIDIKLEAFYVANPDERRK